MRDDLKLRVYLSAVVMAMVCLYVFPFWVGSEFKAAQDEFLKSCIEKYTNLGFDFCWPKSQQDAELPFWNYLSPYLFAFTLLWFNWLLKSDFRFTVASYPRLAMNILLWLGMLVAGGGIYFPIAFVLEPETANLYKISLHSLWSPPWFAFAWLSAPLLFQQLLGPVAMAPSMKKGKILLLLLAATPVIAFAVAGVRSGMRDYWG